MNHRHVLHVPIGSMVLRLSIVQVWNGKKWPRRSGRVPGKDVAVGVPASNGGMIRRYSECGNWPRFDGCGMLALQLCGQGIPALPTFGALPDDHLEILIVVKY